MSYLARLKSLNPVMRPPGKPSKPSKAPFEGFEGTYGPGVAENTTALHSAASECAGHLWSTGDGDEAERAAIIEYDGCVPRELAEALARLLSSPPLAGDPIGDNLANAGRGAGDDGRLPRQILHARHASLLDALRCRAGRKHRRSTTF